MARRSQPITFGHRALMPRPLRRILELLLPFTNWNRFYAALSYLRSTLWVVPAVAIQIAGGQLTPRIIATTLLRDRVIKYTVGLNVFSMLLAVTALNRTEGTVFELVTLVVALLGIACLAAFLFLIDYSARLLRPVRIVALVCDEGMQVVRAVYPQLDGETVTADTTGSGPGTPREAARVVAYQGRSQVVLAVDLESLVAEARRCDGIIEIMPQVGDFVATDAPLLQLRGAERRRSSATPSRRGSYRCGPR